MLKKALQKAKKGEDKKVSINFQVPSLLKEDFEILCRDHNVSVTAMLNSLMEVAIDENNQTSKDESVNSLQDTIISMSQLIENNVDESDVGFDPMLIKSAAEAKLKTMIRNPDYI